MSRVIGDGVTLGFGENLQAVLGDELVECHAVRAVEVVGRRAVLAEVQHPAQRAAAQVVCDVMPVLVEAVAGAGLSQCGGEAGVPVEDRAAGVEGEGADVG